MFMKRRGVFIKGHRGCFEVSHGQMSRRAPQLRVRKKNWSNIKNSLPPTSEPTSERYSVVSRHHPAPSGGCDERKQTAMLSSSKPETPRQAFDKAETEGDSASNLNIISAIKPKLGGRIIAALDVPDVPPADAIAVDPEVETADDLLAELDMTPALEAESDEEIMRALDSSDDIPDHPLPVTPIADWLTDVQELARKHGPFAPWQIVQIIRALNAPADEASR
jgi:hypothetical protein